MKYLFYIFFLFLGLSSCKKEKSPVEATKKNIQGRWNLNTYTATGYDANGFPTSTNVHNYKPGDYIEFTESQFTVFVDNRVLVSEPYTLANARHFSTPEFQNTTNGRNIFKEVDIKELSANKIVLFILQVSNSNNVSSTGEYAASR